mgnify:CR=1 FL=1
MIGLIRSPRVALKLVTKPSSFCKALAFSLVISGKKINRDSIEEAVSQDYFKMTFSHLDKTGNAKFVDTSLKKNTPREAEAEAFVKIGDIVSKGDTLCIIEAMKIMNEIEAEKSGKITEVVANNGEPVEFNQTLFLIDPT